MIHIQETKWKTWPKGIIRSLASSNRFVDWATSCFEGASRGIVNPLDTRVVQLVGVEKNNYTLSCKFRNCEDDFS